VSLNRWVFKWRLKVRMFSHSRMSAGREFQVDGAATEKARRASSVCMRGTTSIGASEERRARGGARVCTSSLRYVGVAVVLTCMPFTGILFVKKLLAKNSVKIVDIHKILRATRYLFVFNSRPSILKLGTYTQLQHLKGGKVRDYSS